MLTAIIIILVWITLMTLILRNIAPIQIKAMQDFFKIVMPKIPFAGIIEAFKKKKD
jgi:hypothetical protein